MTVRLTRRLLLAALFVGPAAVAAELPRPLAAPPVVPAAATSAQILLRCEAVEVKTADLTRIGKAFDAHRTPTGWLFDAATADTFRAACEAANGKVVTRPQMMVVDGQTAFIQSGQQHPVSAADGSGQVVNVCQTGMTLKVTTKLLDGDRAELRLHCTHVGLAQSGGALETHSLETIQQTAFGRTLVVRTQKEDKTVLLSVTATRVASPVPNPLPPVFAAPPVQGAQRADSWLPTDMARDLATQQAQARLPQSNLLARWHPPAWPQTAPPVAVGYRLADGQAVQLVQAVPPPSPSLLLTGSPVMPALRPVAPPSRTFHVRDLPLPPAAPAVCTKTFSVMDLVTPVPGFAMPPAAVPAESPTADTNATALVKLLTAHVRPGSWKPDGGPGSAEFYGIGGVLVVNHTPEAVREVETLLDALRKAQDTCIHTEVHVVRLPVGEAEKLGLCDGPPAADKPSFRNDQQMYDAREAMRGNPRFADMQMPKISLFNGQAGSFCVGEPVNPADKDTAVLGGLDSPGVVVSLQPVVSADRRTVRVSVGGKVWCNPETPLAVKHVAAIPDGGTLVLYAGRRAERVVRCEFGPPVLSQIPYVNRLFKNTGIGTEPAEDVFVLVTPRVVVNREPGEAAVAQAAFAAPPVSPAAGLVARYKAALAAGRTDEAVRLAVQALALDPHCFGR